MAFIMGSSTIILSLLVIGLSIYYFFFKSTNIFKKNGIPHIPPLPIFGNMIPITFRRAPVNEFIQKLYNLNPDAKYVGFYSFSTPIIVIRDPDIIKSIAVKNFESFPNHHTMVENTAEPLLSKNLFALRGQRWKEMRTLLSPFFTASKMKIMFRLIRDCASSFAESLEQLGNNEYDLKDIFSRYTNDVIARCAFGIEVDSMRNPKNDFYMNCVKMVTPTRTMNLKFIMFTACPKLSKWLGIRIVDKKLSTFFENTIEEIIDIKRKTGIFQPDMIQLMLDSKEKAEDRKDLSIEDMTSQAFIFFFAGFETSSTLMCFAVHEITARPDIQEKLQSEIDDILKSVDGEVTYDALNKAKYLDAVVNEALRMYPIAFFMDRVCEKSFELPPVLPGMKPFILKEGDQIWFPAHALCRDPKYFSEPETFNPNRFLDENKEAFNSGVYIPFGAGPRMCVGSRFALLEIKVLLFFLFARCNLKPCSKTQIPLKFSKERPMYPENGFWLRIESRSAGHR